MHKQSPGSLHEGLVDLGELWRHLTSGRLVATRSYCEAGRCWLSLEDQSVDRIPARMPTKTLERVFFGESQKALASELGVSCATIAGTCAAALRRMLPESVVSRAAFLLVAAAHAANGIPLESALVHGLQPDGTWLVSCEVSTGDWRTRLSAAECEVAVLLIQGQKHLEIAALRGTTPRTVANQLASIFGKLRISGRAELRSRAILQASAAFQRRSTILQLPARAVERSAPLDTSPQLATAG